MLQFVVAFFKPKNGGVVMVNFYSTYILCKNESRNATLKDVAGEL